MADCPYCKATITEEISRFGGHCPSCLIDIPGEEAATDPGEGTAVEAAASSRGPLISGLAAAAVVLSAVGFWYLQQPPPDEGGGEERASKYATMPLSSHQDQGIPSTQPLAEESAEQDDQKEDHSERRNRTGGRAPTEHRLVAEGRVIPKAAPSLNPLDAFAAGSGPQDLGPQGIVLSDVGQIESMIGRVLERGNKRLETCYQQKLTVHPGYAGDWQVSVDIARDGSVAGVEVSALKGADGGMARCIRSHVKRWSFQRIAEPISSGYVYRFGN